MRVQGMDWVQARLREPENVNIQVGAWYKIRRVWDGMEYFVKMKAVKEYKHFWLFESTDGWKECFSRWFLARYSM